jgi:hypothetical protein
MDGQPVQQGRGSGLVRGGISVLTTALVWAGLSAWLAYDGLEPSGPGLFEHQYQVQSFLLPPVLLTCWLIFSGILWTVFGARSLATSKGQWLEGIGGIFGNGYFLCWVLPDLLVYWIGGHDLLKGIAPFLPLLTTGFICGVSVQYVRRRVPVERWKAVSWVVFAWVAQAIPLLVLIR